MLENQHRVPEELEIILIPHKSLGCCRATLAFRRSQADD